MTEHEQIVGPRRGFVERLMAAARLDPSVYNEVEHDLSATSQAAGVVAIVAAASALGGLSLPGSGLIGGIVGAVFGWVVWAGVAYLIGDKLLGGTATWGELLRTLGFAQAPGVLYIGARFPLIGWIVPGLVGIWIWVAGVIAIREALDFSTGKAVLIALVPGGFLLLLTWLFAIPAALGG